jgi:hypothetical protein
MINFNVIDFISRKIRKETNTLNKHGNYFIILSIWKSL